MRIPRSYIENYSKALNAVSSKARNSLIEALSKVDFSEDIADIRNKVIAIMQPACGASTTLAARLAAEFYDGLRARFGIDDGFTAEVVSKRIPEATDGAVRAFVQEIVDNKPIGSFINLCGERIDYETRKAANECVAANAERDPKKPRWARIPTGGETCSFCIMLASRGFVYHSEETASHAHANCDCRIVPSWDKSPIAQGYDPARYYEMWKHPERFADKSEETSGLRDASERRRLYEEYQAASSKNAELRRQLRAESDSGRKELLRAEILKAEAAVDEARNKLTNGEFLIETARIYPVGDYYRPEKWGKTPSTNEIVDVLGGGDKTRGSCSSLAFAYFGNKGGYLIRDFRGGSSCNFFSTNLHIKEVEGIDGVRSYRETHRNAFTAADMVLQHAQEGKRYYMSVGQHAAVVEKRGGDVFYLELQSETDNGWHKLTNTELKNRFGCTRSSSISGIKIDQDALLIDGDTLSNNAEFIELMGYINTPENKQKKGAGGGTR